jgi:hypothetical protein
MQEQILARLTVQTMQVVLPKKQGLKVQQKMQEEHLTKQELKLAC